MRCLTIMVLTLFTTSMAHAQSGKVFDACTLKSEILGSERKYAVYLPPDYESSQRSYPVLYLLHGAGDDQTGWVQFGEVLHIADKAIAEGRATPMVIVMPDANTGQRGYFNDIRGKWRYEDFFLEELMPHVEQLYRIKGEKRYRAIAGLSMGGGGSFIYALHRPDLFSSACPLSASVGHLDVEEAKKRFARGSRSGPDQESESEEPLSDEQIEEYFKRYSVLALVQSMPENQRNAVRWYIDCGDDDFLAEGNSLVHIAMRKKSIPHEYRVRDGGHTWSYWRESLPEVLRFVSEAFHQR